jgi:predicted nucleic acid-binding Zn ribbon protein
MPSSVGDALGAFFKNTGLDAVFKEWDAVINWRQVAGERISEVTECERVEDGVMYVRVMSAPWRQELIYLKEPLMESIRRETGCGTIKDIVFY